MLIFITTILITYVNMIIKTSCNFLIRYCIYKYSIYNIYHKISYDRYHYCLARLNDNTITALEFPFISKVHLRSYL